MQVWTANLSVSELEIFVLNELNRLRQKSSKNKRAKRQIKDGERFLKLIHSFPYCKAQKIGHLKKLISSKRNELKIIVQDMSVGLPGYQVSLFDEERYFTPEQQRRIEEQKTIIDEEIVWLHKALGICGNKEYFK